jgi:hypothetical protein
MGSSQSLFPPLLTQEKNALRCVFVTITSGRMHPNRFMSRGGQVGKVTSGQGRASSLKPLCYLEKMWKNLVSHDTIVCAGETGNFLLHSLPDIDAMLLIRRVA